MIISLDVLSKLNVPQSAKENRNYLSEIGGVVGLAQALNLDLERGLTDAQVESLREKFGMNVFEQAPMTSFLELVIESLSDTTIIILMVAAAVSLIIEVIEDPELGWIDGVSIFIAVFLVSIVTSCNNYSKELQFRALEASSQRDERTTVIRNGDTLVINPSELVVGDILMLQVGDSVPADCIVCDNNVVKSSESSLTGEPEDLKKSQNGDCFLLSSCLITEGEAVKAIVIGIGPFSQWGKIKATLVGEAQDTPLQEKLGIMATQIGYFGMVFAIATFIVMVISIWARHHGEHIATGFIEAFIMAVVIVVVAIPEGLPLAVTIALAYSTGKMYDQNCNIRVLAACETMGNATTICSDKTGTLTCNRMTVVEGWFGDSFVDQDMFFDPSSPCKTLAPALAEAISDNCCLNRIAIIGTEKEKEVKEVEKKTCCFGLIEQAPSAPVALEDTGPKIVGNKTEGALILMVQKWGSDYKVIEPLKFRDDRDKKFSFNSTKKRSTTIYHRSDGTVRLLCKGAPEYVLNDCSTFFSSKENRALSLTEAKRKELDKTMTAMTERALRILCLAHKDYASPADLPSDWRENPPDSSGLCCDCIVGIIDPLRDDVKDAVATAQRAGVVVRMITGDSISTACAIARNCGILTAGGTALEGPQFRNMRPSELDDCIHKIQVLARSSPNDKFLMVTRLNGKALPKSREEWEFYHKTANPAANWEDDRDRLLPGYVEEWENSLARSGGQEVVGVTGDGTNDAPALKAADVGLSMGITGTKVAQSASDIVIRDDKFSSIVTAILWGRSVYDNIRKFLQFQLTVNVVALTIVLAGVLGGFQPPLNALMMLWVNLIMDTMGALALATEQPSMTLLDRKPYKLSASLISNPMKRHIICQSIFQLVLLLTLQFTGDQSTAEICSQYKVRTSSIKWNAVTHLQDPVGTLSCHHFSFFCSGSDNDQACFEDATHTENGASFRFAQLQNFEKTCLTCQAHDYTKGTFIFNTFVFCQIFNELNARSISNDWNIFKDIHKNPVFFGVILVSIVLQALMVELGGEAVKTSGLTVNQWIYSCLLGMITIPVGFAMRFIPIEEDPDSFVDHDLSELRGREEVANEKGYEMVATADKSSI